MPSFIVAKLLIRMRVRNEDAEKGVKGDVVVKNLLKAMSPGAMSRPAPLQDNSHVSTPASKLARWGKTNQKYMVRG
jgi:hypothetical protein